MSDRKELCDREGMCWALCERVNGYGLSDQTLYHLKTGKHSFAGVVQHLNKRDKGVFINFCPFCGGKPGEIANREAKT